MTALDILNKNIDKQAQTKLGIQYTRKIKKAALESMQEYADQQLILSGVVGQSEQLLAYTKFLRAELHLNISDTWVESYVKNKQVPTEEEKDLKRRRNHYPFG